jgi:hypothetical protein
MADLTPTPSPPRADPLAADEQARLAVIRDLDARVLAMLTRTRQMTERIRETLAEARG